MNIGLITIGSELLNGTRTDTNATWIGNAVISSGGKVVWHITTNDNKNDIIYSLKNMPKDINTIICTGGLGPTHDDITSKVLFEYFNAKPEFDDEYWELLSSRFTNRGIKIPELNKNQAIKPSNGNIITNPIGSARGFQFENSEYHLFALPGVPSEMKAMMNESVLPWISSKSNNSSENILLRTTGIMESALFEKIEFLVNEYKDIELAFLPRFTGVDLRISSNKKNKIKSFINKLKPLIKKYFYGEGEMQLEDAVAQLLISNQMTISSAESCTGGLIADRLTNVSGSSKYFKGSIVAYSNEIKSSILNINENVIATHGAVSEEVAIAMARAVKNKLKSDIGISTTGIAGPSGGSKDKPVGLVYIGIVSDQYEKVYKFKFTFNRKTNKLMSSQSALNILRIYLLKEVK